MADKEGFNNWLNGVAQRTRKKQIKGKGNDNSVKRGKEYDGPTAGNLVDGSAGARSAARGIVDEKRKKQEKKYMKDRITERNEIKRDPEKTRQQKETNKQALQNIMREVKFSKAGHTATDRGSLMDFASDYVPFNDEVGKAARNIKNREVARRTIKRK